MVNHRDYFLEYGHGISNRLKGGSAQANCLGSFVAGAMGEGWSDTFAIYLTRTAADTKDNDAAMGAYSKNNGDTGIRSKAYSTSMSRNPYTLSSVKGQSRVHDVGEFWANTLYSSTGIL